MISTTLKQNYSLHSQFSSPFGTEHIIESVPISLQTTPIAIKSNQIKSIKYQFCIKSSEFNVNFPFLFDPQTIKTSDKRLSFPVNLDGNILRIVFVGRLSGNNFFTDNLLIDLKKQGGSPQSTYLLSSLSSIMGLSKNFEILIPSLRYRLKTSFHSSVDKISELLQGRQLAYRLMVIEKTFGITLSFPKLISNITAEDLHNLVYSYRSIVDRKFSFIANTKVPVGTIEEEKVVLEIFGQKIDLGIQKRSLTSIGNMEVESITTPILPKNAFNKDIQRLIDLEPKLNDAVFEKYLNSFSNAFEGLSEEQIQVLTERPVLEEEAFNF